MSDTERNEKNEDREVRRGDGAASRNERYKEVYRQTRDHRTAIRAYCAGNRWLEENARAVGNW